METSGIRWQYYPRSEACPPLHEDVAKVFQSHFSTINSLSQTVLKSNDVLAMVSPSLMELGFAVETGKKAEEKLRVPVLYGENGRADKNFDADAWHNSKRTVLEVEAGRAYSNNQFLKDLFQACVMDDVDYLVIAVRQLYKDQKDYELIKNFLDTLYASNRLSLPLKGIQLIGY
jgi:hypothetical protein